MNESVELMTKELIRSSSEMVCWTFYPIYSPPKYLISRRSPVHGTNQKLNPHTSSRPKSHWPFTIISPPISHSLFVSLSNPLPSPFLKQNILTQTMDTVQLLTRQNSSSESLQASNQSDSSHHLDSHHTHQVYPTTTRFNRLRSDHPSIPRPRQYGRLPKFCEDRLSLKSALVILLIFSIITITIHKYGIPLDWSKSDYLEHLNSFGSSSQSSFTNTTSKKKLTERKFLVRDWS